jgi:hypothetical protein
MVLPWHKGPAPTMLAVLAMINVSAIYLLIAQKK